MIRTISTEAFACYSKACAPPPAGKGGSSKGGSVTRDTHAERIYAAHMKPIRDYISRPPVRQPNMTPHQPSARRMAVVGIPRSTGRAKALTRKQAARSRVLGGKWNVPKMSPYKTMPHITTSKPQPVPTMKSYDPATKPKYGFLKSA